MYSQFSAALLSVGQQEGYRAD